MLSSLKVSYFPVYTSSYNKKLLLKSAAYEAIATYSQKLIPVIIPASYDLTIYTVS